MRWIAGFVAVLICTIEASAVVTVDFSKDEGPILHSGSGFLWGITTTSPNDTLISRLNIKMLRAGAQNCNRCAFDIYDRAKSLGVQEIQAIVCEAVGFRQPGTANLSWDSYLSTVTNLVNRAKAENKNIVWDIWNEPDLGQFWSATWDQWLEVWKRTYQAIKAADPNAVTLGPSGCECSMNGVDGGIVAVTSFINYAAANNCMPEVVCWHMNTSSYWIDQHKIESDAHLVRLQLAGLGYDTTKILLSSNEYGDGGYAASEGGCVEYFAQMERARFSTGAKACWGTCNGQSLDGTVDGSTPNQVWWTYRRYGEMNGRKFNVARADGIDGVAAFDSTTNTLNILLGSHLGSSAATTELRIVNYGNLSGAVQVRVEKMWPIPPQVFSTSNVTIAPGGFTLSLPQLSFSNALFVSISDFPYKQNSTIAAHPPIAAHSMDIGVRFLTPAKVIVPSAAYSLRVINTAGAALLQESGIGPRILDLSTVGKGMHIVNIASQGQMVSRTFVNTR